MIFSTTMKGGVNSIKCTRSGGTCENTCDRFTQYVFLSGKAAGCEEEQVCCIDVNKPKPADPRCAKLSEGAYCDDKKLMVCNVGSQCISKCEYCSVNYGTTKGKTICNSETNTIFESADKNNMKLSCACSEAVCSSKSGSCIADYCPGTDKTANDYVCCAVPK